MHQESHKKEGTGRKDEHLRQPKSPTKYTHEISRSVQIYVAGLREDRGGIGAVLASTVDLSLPSFL